MFVTQGSRKLEPRAEISQRLQRYSIRYNSNRNSNQLLNPEALTLQIGFRVSTIPYIMAVQDQRVEAGETNRPLIIGVAIGAAVVIAALFYVLMRASESGAPTEPTLPGAVRAGAPQFDQIKSQIYLDDPEATEAKRALGDIVMTLQTTVRNLTGKTLTGLEINAAVVDYEGKPVKQRAVVVIPTRQAELAPNKTMQVAITLDGMKDADARANIKMEVTGFKIKE